VPDDAPASSASTTLTLQGSCGNGVPQLSWAPTQQQPVPEDASFAALAAATAVSSTCCCELCQQAAGLSGRCYEWRCLQHHSSPQDFATGGGLFQACAAGRSLVDDHKVLVQAGWAFSVSASLPALQLEGGMLPCQMAWQQPQAAGAAASAASSSGTGVLSARLRATAAAMPPGTLL
jgi:hypothetical protein